MPLFIFERLIIRILLKIETFNVKIQLGVNKLRELLICLEPL